MTKYLPLETNVKWLLSTPSVLTVLSMTKHSAALNNLNQTTKVKEISRCSVCFTSKTLHLLTILDSDGTPLPLHFVILIQAVELMCTTPDFSDPDF